METEEIALDLGIEPKMVPKSSKGKQMLHDLMEENRRKAD